MLCAPARMRLTGWRYIAFAGSIVGSIGVVCYFTMIAPMLNPEPYKLIREHAIEYRKKSTNRRNETENT